MLVDTNLLLYAVHEEAGHHKQALSWLTERLNGPHRVGLPWQSLGGFLRLATNPRALPSPLSSATAWQQVEEWLAAPASWVPLPGPEHGRILGELVVKHELRANLIPDAMLAALALELGLTMCSTDTDFARFAPDGLRWHNPLV
jgi:toxin-antitoxin system PIN domain toxin